MGRGGNNLLYGNVQQSSIDNFQYPCIAELFPDNKTLAQLQLNFMNNFINWISYETSLDDCLRYKMGMTDLWHREGLKSDGKQIGNLLWQVNITKAKFDKMLKEKVYEAQEIDKVIETNKKDKTLNSIKSKTKDADWIRVAFPQERVDQKENKIAIADHPSQVLLDNKPIRGYGIVDFNHLLSVETLTKQAFAKCENMQWHFSPNDSRIYYSEKNSNKIYGSLLIVE